MEAKFEKFLRENNCYGRYMDNSKGEYTDECICAFTWCDTPEGDQYWRDLDAKWYVLSMRKMYQPYDYRVAIITDNGAQFTTHPDTLDIEGFVYEGGIKNGKYVIVKGECILNVNDACYIVAYGDSTFVIGKRGVRLL